MVGTIAHTLTHVTPPQPMPTAACGELARMLAHRLWLSPRPATYLRPPVAPPPRRCLRLYLRRMSR